MADEMVKSRLGRGLAALIGDADDDYGSGDRHRNARRIPVEFLRRNPRNPRQHFAETDLAELADSIRERGIIQPIVVRPLGHLPDLYEIVAGERRWRAAQLAGLHEVPIVVVEADDRLALEFAIIENVQRRDLNALEEAGGYEQLLQQHGYTQTDLAQTLGKSRSHIANTLRLLKLPAGARDHLARGEISAGHARALLTVVDPDGMAERIIRDGLTVRDIERISQEASEPSDRPKRGRPRAQPAELDADTHALQRQLETALGLKVSVHHAQPGGEIRIRYDSVDQLDAICRAVGASAA